MSVRYTGIGMTSQRTRDRLVERLRAQGIANVALLEVMRQTPRHIFVDEALASRAYEDTALPIGHGQTISQPYVVARMCEALLGERRPERVLEVGTGCGYQTAVLAQLVDTVYSVERVGALLKQARERLYALRLHNIRLHHGDGTLGWAAHAPYDGILLAAAPPVLPPALYEQLAPGGRLVAPVGPRGSQRLMLVVREESGLREQWLEPVSFVPLVGGTG
jgi:protein-L-isoaspartate(D-aspartate) O-methyltransferase